MRHSFLKIILSGWTSILRFFAGLLVCLSLASASFAKEIQLPQPPSCQGYAECARRFVVSVLPVLPDRSDRREEPEGSGIIVGEGKLIVTASHVLGSATKVMVRTWNGEVIPATIVLHDPATDVALLKIRRSLPAAPFAPSVHMGERACALGNAFGLDIALTCGVVSALQVSGTGFNRIEDFVQTDAAVNPGMSGGALINQRGELLGMLSAIFTKGSDSNIGVNFAVSSGLLSRIIADFRQSGKPIRVIPGLIVRPSLKPAEAGISGARIVRVQPNSAEALAGVSAGDVLLSVNGRRMKRAGSYQAALALIEKGNTIPMNILRNGEVITIQVRFD